MPAALVAAEYAEKKVRQALLRATDVFPRAQKIEMSNMMYQDTEKANYPTPVKLPKNF